MSARGFEHWFTAYERILREVETEHPDWDDIAQYEEYRRRFARWKLEVGLSLSSDDLEALASPVVPDSGEGDRG